MLTPKSINQFKQNKPSLIVDDLLNIHPTQATKEDYRDKLYEILLSRGVFKWFSVRRKLIKAKDHWKDRLKTALDYQILARYTGRWNRVWYWRGYRRALEECRADVRRLCHEPRWQVQDNDQASQRWLWTLEDKMKQEVIELEKKKQYVENLVLPDCEGLSCEVPKDSSGNL